jgi:PucR C-terminal helix-turn-helix domain/GGDEF-like domain
MVNGVGVVVGRLRARRGEIEEAIFTRVREVVPGPAGDPDSEYVEGLRAAVAAAVEFGLVGIERGVESSLSIPSEAVAQAHRAARNGVSLEAVLRRYIVGHALLWDYVMEEADRVDLAGRASGLREILRAQASLLDRLVIGVTREHGGELQRAGRSREQRLFERVRMLLAGERVDGVELGYELDAEHLGVIARGRGSREILRGVAEGLDRRLLSVTGGEGTVWAWLGSQRVLQMGDLERVLSAQTTRLGDGGGATGRLFVDVSFAVGEPARGLEGWRLTHRQAQAALLVALRRPRRLTRYRDVALLAAALGDETLARSLIDMYLSPLEDSRGGGAVLRQTLRAYLAAERNTSSAAAALGVVRKTVESRLRTIEEKLGRSLHPCPAELEVALRLDALARAPGPPEISIVG